MFSGKAQVYLISSQKGLTHPIIYVRINIFWRQWILGDKDSKYQHLIKSKIYHEKLEWYSDSLPSINPQYPRYQKAKYKIW